MIPGIERWIFEIHSQETIWNWVKDLRYFAFKRAYGGHANDGDTMIANIRYTDHADMLNKLDALGIHIETLPIDEPFLEIGRTYSGEEFMKYKVRIGTYPELEAPCFQTLCGKKVFIWVDRSSIEFSVAGTRDGNIYEVSEDDILLCKEIESLFDSLGWQDLKQDPTYTTEHRIDKKVMEERYGYGKIGGNG